MAVFAIIIFCLCLLYGPIAFLWFLDDIRDWTESDWSNFTFGALFGTGLASLMFVPIAPIAAVFAIAMFAASGGALLVERYGVQ